MLCSLLKHDLDLNITDTALKVSQSLYCFTTSLSHGVENYFPRLWDTGISDAIFEISKDLQFAIGMATYPRKTAWSFMEWLIRGNYLKLR